MPYYTSKLLRDLPYPIILASGSPRRRELLRKLVPNFEIVVPYVDERSFVSGDPYDTAIETAKAKAMTIAAAFPNHIVIGGDTIVAYKDGEDWHQLAKPETSEVAIRMLQALSGREHIVITGICIITPKSEDSDTVESRVIFRELSPQEIQEYVDTDEPMDKAGAYAVQGMAAKFVERIEGSMTNIIGLPLERLQEILDSIATMRSEYQEQTRPFKNLESQS